MRSSKFNHFLKSYCQIFDKHFLNCYRRFFKFDTNNILRKKNFLCKKKFFFLFWLLQKKFFFIQKNFFFNFVMPPLSKCKKQIKSLVEKKMEKVICAFRTFRF